jgi:hypothetical protein
MTTSTEALKETHKVTLGKNTWEIDLYSRSGFHPHGYSMDNDNLGTYTEGGVEIVTNAENQWIVSGYDGTYTLPLPVAVLLSELGYGFAPYVFPHQSIRPAILGFQDKI